MKAADIKRASERALQALGVPVNSNLPLIDNPSRLQPRSAKDVAARAWVLSHIAYLGYGSSTSEMRKLIEKARLEEHVSPNEWNLLKSRRLGAARKNWAGWMAEAVHGCAWALRVVDSGPLADCPSTLAKTFAVDIDPWPGIEKAKLRGFDQLYRRADLSYRLHWAARHLLFEGATLPQREIAFRLRRWSADWIVGVPYAWDDMPLDT
jgi:hypothetical protein